MNTGVDIKTEFFPLAWFLFFVTPTIEINGVKHKQKWGESFFSLTPGEHLVKISFPYFGMNECGANEVKFSITEGQKRKINYNMPPWMFSKGSINIS